MFAVLYSYDKQGYQSGVANVFTDIVFYIIMFIPSALGAVYLSGKPEKLFNHLSSLRR